MTDGWDASAEAWIASQGERGDYARHMVLDKPMLARIKQRPVDQALDIGCGEGRFCRKLAAEGISVVGIDPTKALLARARSLHPEGNYRKGRAESLDFADGSFDLVVSYLTLIDIPDIGRAIPEMTRVLRPGGRLLIANLTNLITGSPDMDWVRGEDGERLFFRIDDYSRERSTWAEWDGIRIVNWHRPLSRYMSLLIAQGLILRYFDEPQPEGGDPARVALYQRVPWFMIMEWEKPS